MNVESAGCRLRNICHSDESIYVMMETSQGLEVCNGRGFTGGPLVELDLSVGQQVHLP
jgi:hypothetical protein